MNTGGTMREERKVVTALFADVVGSTEITERLDPEDARELLGAAVTAMIEAVDRFGGTVKDLAGDGVLALFGAPVAHEDDDERAVRAGLRIVANVRRAAGDGSSSEHPTLSVRIGIESGVVVLGPVGAGTRVEYGATGDAINVAARLQSHAPPDGILVGRVTHQAIRAFFDWGEERRLELKGKADPVSAFEVLNVRDRADRRRDVQRIATPMIGREEELARASATARRLELGEGGVLMVVGEPGIGKSRLVEEVRLEEARREVESATVVRWLEGRCTSFGQTTPYFPFREVVLDALDIAHDEPKVSDVLRTRLPAVLSDELDDVAPYLEAVLGAQERTRQLSPETLQFRTLEALRLLFRGLAAHGPLVVSIEDLHWADPSSLQTIERLVPSAVGTPILFVLTFRDEDGSSDRLRRLASALPDALREMIELRRLDRGRDDDLLDALIGADTLPLELRSRVVDTCGGNPFFIGELVRSLIDSGVLLRDGETWSIAHDATVVDLPATIEKVILARLDLLEPEARDVLTAASVLGREVSVQLLERLLDTDPRPNVGELRRLELLDGGGPQEELRFRHALIRDVAYGSLLKRRRHELHARAAAAIGDIWPDRIDEHLAVLAYHHRGAGDLESARRFHELAAERAERLYAGEEALEHLSSAISIAGDLGRTPKDREMAQLLTARARVRARTGDVAGAKTDLERVLDGAGDLDLLTRAHDELGFVLAGAADYRQAVPHLQAALEGAMETGDRAAEVSALSRLALVHTNRLDLEAGAEHGHRALGLAESIGDERSIATAMDGLKQVALETGDFETLERLAGRLASIHRKNDDLWLLQFAVFEVGYADVARSRLDLAFAHLEESLAINQRIGDLGNEPLHVGALGSAYRGRGEYDSALAFGRRAFALARELHHGEWTAWTAVELAGTLLEVGALEEASRLLAEGARAADRSAADMHLVRCLGVNAWATYRLGDRDRALGLADRASSIFGRIRVRPPRAYVPGRDAYAAVARVRIEEGELEAATSLLEPVVVACETCGWSDGIVDGRLVLAEAALRRGDVPGAIVSADRAVAEALRASLPTAWRAHAVLAEGHRAAGDDERAAAHLREGQEAVARLLEGIEDVAIRDALSVSAAESLTGGGRRG